MSVGDPYPDGQPDCVPLGGDSKLSMAWQAHSLSVLTEARFEMGIGIGKPGIEDVLCESGLPVVTPGERLSQVRDTVTSLECAVGD